MNCVWVVEARSRRGKDWIALEPNYVTRKQAQDWCAWARKRGLHRRKLLYRAVCYVPREAKP
jgi:hypothetical protein